MEDQGTYREDYQTLAPLLDPQNRRASSRRSTWSSWRQKSRSYLRSKQKHYIILAMVTIDVLAILADIFVSLITCDTGGLEAALVEQVQDAIKFTGLVFSTFFLIELMFCLWAFGVEYGFPVHISNSLSSLPYFHDRQLRQGADLSYPRFFSSWFHCLDGFVIVVSFGIDVLAHGVVEEIASLVIILRLWRLVKIVEELGVGVSERMEELETRLGQLEREKRELKSRLASRDREHHSETRS